MPANDVELRPAWRNYWAGFMVAALFLSMPFFMAGDQTYPQDEAAGGIWLLAATIVMGVIVFKRFSWKYTISDRRLSRHYGIVARNQQNVRIQDLRSVELNQSLVQRILDTGDLAFYSAGSAHAEVTFFGIERPLEWRDSINETVDRLKDSSD